MTERFKGARLLGANDSQCTPLAMAKSSFDMGNYKEALILGVPMSEGLYNVVVKGRGYWTFISAARTPKEPKVYKSLDAAMSELRKIGFKAATVEVD